MRDENYNHYANNGDICGKFYDGGRYTKRINYLTMDEFNKVFVYAKTQANLMVILDEVEELLKELGRVVTYKNKSNDIKKFVYRVGMMCKAKYLIGMSGTLDNKTRIHF